MPIDLTDVFFVLVIVKAWFAWMKIVYLHTLYLFSKQIKDSIKQIILL